MDTATLIGQYYLSARAACGFGELLLSTGDIGNVWLQWIVHDSKTGETREWKSSISERELYRIGPKLAGMMFAERARAAFRATVEEKLRLE